MSQKIVSQLDADGYFRGPATADESPRDPGKFLLPGGCIDREPPAVIEPGKRYRPHGDDWTCEDMPEQTPIPTPANSRVAEIYGRLLAIDSESIRPAREIATAVASAQAVPAFAASKLTALESEAAALRDELWRLLA
ncbi:hypothetical protein [Rhodocyclus tenuis]|uniref:Uncharacterized protein n=1 Tax=Rhodocyclus tenuis TaxID=1066 RepID=A0A840GEC3_RHOTE|nr:hypothetical protein [Rhodocyclus tenuis]MBB4246569.1 hypothetical protein [Rhodocyclus tenuis]